MAATTTSRRRVAGRADSGRLPRWWPALAYWVVSWRRTWRASAFTAFVSPLLYLGSLGFGLGSLVDGGTGGRIDGLPYAEFVAPGLLAAAAMQAAFGEGSYPVLGAMIWTRQYHAQLATPLTSTDIFVGHLAFVVVRVVVTSTSFLLVGGLLGAFRSPSALFTPAVAVVCGLAHAPLAMGYAVRQRGDAGLAILFRLVMIPMFLFAGTFFPVSQLPVGLQVLAWATPLWHATTVCRDLAVGVADPLGALGHLGYLCLWAIVGWLWATRRYRTALGS